MPTATTSRNLSQLSRCEKAWPQQPLLGLLRRTKCSCVSMFKDLTTQIILIKASRLKKELQRRHGRIDFNENMEKAQTESNLSITIIDINIELSKEFLVKLRKKAFHGWIDEDVMDHIAKVLEMIDLIYILGVDSHQLQMKIFPLLLADDA
ncbi:hypothetical protein Tco_0458655 [Tanacetum coccineum]